MLAPLVLAALHMWLDDSDRRQFQPGCSLLHDLDPRVKLAACLLLVILIFAATSWVSLALLAAATVSTACLSRLSLVRLAGACWSLRWLLFFTLFMHLLMTPGRTLWGTSWLSLDGLLVGLRVDAQILLALFCVQMSALTTSMADFARTFGWFMSPLRWFGIRVDGWQDLLLQAMHFLPIVRDEARANGSEARAEAGGSNNSWDLWSARLEGFVLRLVERGETLARRMAAGEPVGESLGGLPPLLPLAASEMLFVLGFGLLAFLCRLTG